MNPDTRTEEDSVHPDLLHQAAVELCEVITALQDAALSDDLELTEDTRVMQERVALVKLMQNAVSIPGRIRANIHQEAYWFKMENALLIKRAAVEMQLLVTELEVDHPEWIEYIRMITDQIDLFRKLFVIWVKSFDSTVDPDDGWGLFT